MPPPNAERIEELLAYGLELFGRGREADAVAAWREVLQLAPGEPRATDYLETAGAEPTPAVIAPVIELDLHRPREPQPASGGAAGDESWRATVVALVAASRFEEALELLYREGARRPGQAGISRSIRDLKARLCLDWATQLGGLDRVPRREDARAPATFEQHAVLARINGLATVDDIASSSPLGRFRAIQALVALFGDAPSPAREAGRALGGEETREIQRSEVATPAVPADPVLDFDRLFAEAIRASVNRRYEEAERLFGVCERLRPQDPHVKANLARLRKRSGGA